VARIGIPFGGLPGVATPPLSHFARTQRGLDAWVEVMFWGGVDIVERAKRLHHGLEVAQDAAARRTHCYVRPQHDALASIQRTVEQI